MGEAKDRTEAPTPVVPEAQGPREERARRRRDPVPEEMPSGTFRIPRV